MKASRECNCFIAVGIIILAVRSIHGSSGGAFEAQVPSGSSSTSLDAISGPMTSSAESFEDQNANSTETGGLVRERRFIRFPSGPGPIYEGPGPTGRNTGFPNVRYPSQGPYTPWRQQKSSFWRPPGPTSDYPRPVMGHRTPRLIFRDDFPSLPGSGSGNSFFQSNQLPELDEDYRGKVHL